MSGLKEEHRPKGTAVLTYVFLIVMAMYYFLSWKFLMDTWKVG